MIFHPDMIQSILNGRKTRTTRPMKRAGTRSVFFDPNCRYVVGRTYGVQPGRGKRSMAHIRIVGVASYSGVDTAVHRDAEHVVLEGFKNSREFFLHWNTIYRKSRFLRLAPVWVIDFELVEPAPG